MATLTINFTPPTNPPSSGYKVFYREVGGTTYEEVTATSSPVTIPDVLNGYSYEGYIHSDCGDDFFSAEVPFTANPILPCGIAGSYTGGETMPFEQMVTLGSTTGTVTLTFDAYDIPDKFEVWFDGAKVIDTGYRGNTSYQAALEAEVVSPGTIVSPGSGTATFEKTTATTTATVRIFAPLTDTSWGFTLSCPDPGE